MIGAVTFGQNRKGSSTVFAVELPFYVVDLFFRLFCQQQIFIAERADTPCVF